MAAEQAEINRLREASAFWPIWIGSLLIFVVIIWLGLKIPQGILAYPDELFTAERAREMVIKSRDTVYFNFQPSFYKPPLQYWLTTLTLPRFANAAAAVRIWPLLYGVLTAIAVGWIAFLVDPKRPWLIALSIAIFVSCPLFSTEARRALLDTGLMFFTTVAIAFAELARRHPTWWVGVGVVCWLGALQKIPLIFLVWLIILVTRAANKAERARLRSFWLPTGIVVGIALVAIWPLFQHVKYGMPIIRAFAGDPASELFGQDQLGSRSYFKVLSGLMVAGWAGGGFAVLAALSFLIYRKRVAPALVTEMSILALVIVFLAVVFNFRAVRYVLPIVPAVCIVLAFFLHGLGERDEIRVGVLIFVIVFVLGGFIQSEIKLRHRGADVSREQRVARELGAFQNAETSMILVKNPGMNPGLRSSAFYLFHGALRFPLKRYSIDKFQKAPPQRPAIGVCVDRDFPAVQSIYPDARPFFTLDYFICWRTDR